MFKEMSNKFWTLSFPFFNIFPYFSRFFLFLSISPAFPFFLRFLFFSKKGLAILARGAPKHLFRALQSENCPVHRLFPMPYLKM